MRKVHKAATLPFMQHSAYHSHPHEHDPDDSAVGDMLELDAAVMGAYLDTAIAHIRHALDREPTVIVDVGAGTGVGLRALARAFPDSEVFGVDASPEMAIRAGSQAPDNVRTVTADVNNGWPAGVPTADIIWASSSLHHVAAPEVFLREAAAYLRTGGVLAVIEMTGPPRFLQGDDPLEVHIVAAMDTQQWNSFPDWTGAIEKAGLDVVDRVDLTVEVDMLSDNVFRYADAWFSRVRLGLADELSEDDRATLDALVSAESPGSIRRRTDLAVRGGRTMWIAKPRNTTEPRDITEYTDDRSEILP